MNRRRRTLLLGLVLVLLLAGGIVAAILWPTPSEAERMAALIQVGMTSEDVARLLPGKFDFDVKSPEDDVFVFFEPTDPDGPAMYLTFAKSGPRRVTAVWTTRGHSRIPPLTRLRRTLARALPFLGE